MDRHRILLDMSRHAAVTIVSKRHLPLARVTAQTFREHNPGTPFYVLLADDEQGLLDPACEPFELLHMEDLGIAELKQFQFQHTEMELSYACTPYAVQCLLRRGFGGVLFLKQETMVLADLSPIWTKLTEHSVLLTPHLLAPPDRSNAARHEIRVLRAGVYNGGVIGFANDREANGFLEWWQGKVFRSCLRDTKLGCHFEQRWLDFVPSLVPRHHLIRDPGVNVGHWNLRERQVQVHEGRVMALGVPCRVFRFSGYQADRPDMVTKYNRHYTVASTGAAAAVFARYQALLMAAGYTEAKRFPYAYERYDDGVVISARARRACQQANAAQQAGNPFARRRWLGFGRWFQKGGKA